MRDETIFASPKQNVRLEDCIWYHVMDIPGVGTVQGGWDLRRDFPAYVGNLDLTGKTVLDVGTASGFLSFSAEKAGANEVVSFDIDIGDRQHLLPFHDSLYYRNHAQWAKERTEHFNRWKNGYWLAHKAFNSKAKAIYGDVYNIDPRLGAFDVVIFCAVLEHLSDPIRALASVARHAADRLVLGVYIPEETHDSIAWFLGNSKVRENGADAVFWAYSMPIYREILTMLGFSIESSETREFPLSDGRTSPRTTIVAKRSV